MNGLIPKSKSPKSVPSKSQFTEKVIYLPFTGIIFTTNTIFSMLNHTNQNPEQVARDLIDKMLTDAGRTVQSKNEVDFYAAKGIALREYQAGNGAADYILFINRKPVGVIEAKREEEGHRLTVVEDQAVRYAVGKLKHFDNEPLPFVYESTGTVTQFTDYRDSKPRARNVFSFHRPKTLQGFLKEKATLRARLNTLPPLPEEGLRPAQIKAVRNLERSFKENRPKALIQMATGAGKTFTACTFVYRLLKHADAKRILFLVDTKNLGEQAEQEFRKYQPRDDNRKFTELYNVQRLNSSYIAADSQVCISTIQRLYSILQEKQLDEVSEQENPNERGWQPKDPLPVGYNATNPIEQFDFIIIDECHRSIYNLWKQVLDYYDAFLIGLTATPDKRTYGFFNENVVSEYTFEESVTDGVNVPYDIFTIETEITKNGSSLRATEYVDFREKLSRKKCREQLDEDYIYQPNALDKKVVNPNQIRQIVKAFKDCLPGIFPDRYNEQGVFEVPKTLIFAKTDSHADDIIKIVREEFGESNEFCKKVTYGSKNDREDADGNVIEKGEKAKDVLKRFRSSWNPRIAVTVDMIATGTDVKPLEILLFMRDVRSVNYFEQMKGRGTRTINFDDLRKVSSTAKHTKTHFIIIDAVGATKTKKTDSRPPERKRSVPLKALLEAVTYGNTDEDLFTSLANRLIRLDKQLTEKEKTRVVEITGGKDLKHLVKNLLNAYDPDAIAGKTAEHLGAIPQAEQTPAVVEDCEETAREALLVEAARPFTGELNTYIENARKTHEQIIDHINLDKLLRAEFDSFTEDKTRKVVKDFKEYLAENKDEIRALRIFYNQPYQRRDVTFKMIKEVMERLKADRPQLAPHYVWEAYEKLEEVKDDSPKTNSSPSSRSSGGSRNWTVR